MAVNVEYIIRLNDQLSKKLRAVQGQVDKLNAKVKTTNSSFGGLGKTAVRAFAAIGAVSVIKELTTVTAHFESLDNAIKFTSGSTEEYIKNQKFLHDLSKDFGLDLLATTEGYKDLTGAMLGLGFTGDQQRKMFKQVNIAVSAMGLSADDTKGALRALGQMMSKGKVQAEELRGQLGERIPGAFNIAARAMGVTTAELDKMMEQGKLIADDFLPKFAQELENTFKGALGDSTKSARANLNRFNNKMHDVKIMLGKHVVPVVLKLADAFVHLIEWIEHNIDVIKEIAIVLGVVFVATQVYSVMMWKAALAAEGFTVAQWLLNTAMSLNPIALVVIAIAALVVVVIAIIRHYETWGAALLLLLGPFGRVINMVQSFRRNWDDLKKAFTFDGIGAGLMKIGAILIDSLLMPMQQLLELASNIPGLGGIAAKGATKILELRKSLGINTEDLTKKDLAAAQNKALAGLDFESMLGGKEGAKLGESLTDKSGGGILDSAGSGGALGTKVSEFKANAPKIFNINIDKLVESLNISTTNLKESATRIKEEVERALLTAITDASIISE